MNEILSILLQDARTSIEDIAVMTGKSIEEVAATIQELEDNHVILGYKPLINWEKTDREYVKALIELKVTPQLGEGFDAIAERIYSFPQVLHLYLMSGAYDLAVFVEGKNIKEVAMFVSEKLAPMASVLSTATHFMLKTYKREGVIFEGDNKDTREVITL